MVAIAWLSPHNVEFPPVENALDYPKGLLAAGGDLSSPRLIAAYRQGIFPWYEEDQPILWWCPNPRTVLFPNDLKISRSLAKTLRQQHFKVTFNHAFEQVIRQCAAPRAKAQGTWLTEDMIRAYCRLHQQGLAHSVETWFEDQLAGGLYGLTMGKIFFGESMFAHRSDASKVAFVHLVQHLKSQQCPLIDCQVGNPHLLSLGARDIPLADFQEILNTHVLSSEPLRWPKS